MKKTVENLSKTIFICTSIFMVSCKKDYVCKCVQTVTVPGYTNGSTVYPQQVIVNSVTNTFQSKPKEAESGCNQGEYINSYPSPYESVGQGPTVETVTCGVE
ncbi:MAG: hypothetical protein IPP69_13815 [Flavobacteriales bacterium]|nr:hypothetical protein [Flavobacteriales bacterium]